MMNFKNSSYNHMKILYFNNLSPCSLMCYTSYVLNYNFLDVLQHVPSSHAILESYSPNNGGLQLEGE